MNPQSLTLTLTHHHRILFECVSGSRAYGASNAESDIDIRGVFAQHSEEFVALAPPPVLIADERHTVYPTQDRNWRRASGAFLRQRLGVT